MELALQGGIQTKEDQALNLLNGLFAVITIPADNNFTVKDALSRSKDIAKSRREHAEQIERYRQQEAEFERKINDPAFRLMVVLTIIENEKVEELVALNRTSTKAKLSQEALKYDLIY